MCGNRSSKRDMLRIMLENFSILHRVCFSFSLYVYVTMVCVYVYMRVWMYVGTCMGVHKCDVDVDDGNLS